MYRIYSSWDKWPLQEPFTVSQWRLLIFRNVLNVQRGISEYTEHHIPKAAGLCTFHLSTSSTWTRECTTGASSLIFPELLTCGLLLVCCCHQQFYVTPILRVLGIKFRVLKALHCEAPADITQWLHALVIGCSWVEEERLLVAPRGLSQKGHHSFEVQVHKLWNSSNSV